MANNNQNQRLNGFTPLSYVGANAIQPTNFTTSALNPTSDDSIGFNLGDWWLNTTDNSIWYLASTNGLTATWINATGSGPSGLLELTGNTGPVVEPLNQNINLLGDNTTVSIAGNPGTSTLTASLLPTIPTSLTSNSGGPVSPTAGNIDLKGSGDVTITGDPATHTLTISAAPQTPITFQTQAGNAVPADDLLNIIGTNGISTSASGSTVTVTANGSIAQSYITSPATGTAIPAAGVITLAGTGTTTVSATGSTITISNTTPTPVVTYSEGTFIPFISVNGVNTGTGYYGRKGYYVQIGNVVYISVFIQFSTPASGNTGPIGIGGMPYISANSYGTANGNFSWLTNPQNIANTTWYLIGKMVQGTTYLQFYVYRTDLSRQVTVTNTSTFPGSGPFNIIIQGFYFI